MTGKQTTSCEHSDRACLNQHELIRKYHCSDCGAVMMCTCDRAFGERFLAHQLDEGCEIETQIRVPVTHGFEPNICSECRALPADPAPAAAIMGRTSKIKRYYWRELFFATRTAQSDWDEANLGANEEERRSVHTAIEKRVLDEIKDLHAKSPKYAFTERSQAQVIAQYGVEVETLTATYAENATKGAQIRDGAETISVEEFATRYYRNKGWHIMQLESVPFHVLFGTMNWLLIQGYDDPMFRMVSFGDRTAFDEKRPGEMIWTHLPSDFGSRGYGERRADAIDEHFDAMLLEDDPLWLFDYWLGPSEGLRQYLWAHRQDDIGRARHLIEILPFDTIKAILRYLVDSYWDRYLGWPDLLLYRDSEFMFVEVKSSSDKLSEDQKRWIAGNHDILKLPFVIAKVHRCS